MRDGFWDFLVRRSDLVQGDDGEWIYWPSGWNRGALSSRALRRVAKEMDRLNRENAKRIAAAFKKRRPMNKTSL